MNSALTHFQTRASERLDMPLGVARQIWRHIPELIAGFDALDPQAMEVVDFVRSERKIRARRWFSVNLPDWPRFAVLVSPDGTPVTCMTMQMLKSRSPSKGRRERQERARDLRVEGRAIKLPPKYNPEERP